MRQGQEAILALQYSAVLPVSTAAVRQALDVARAGDAQFAGGALGAFLDILAEQPVVTPVWTGPESEESGGRLTLAVLADLIGEARREILLVSYATMPSVEIRTALANAVAQGVEVITLLEREVDNPKFNGHGVVFGELPIRRICWPGAIRPAGAALHAKVLVVDRSVALVGSANLTDYGLERNLECGLLVRGGPVPRQIAAHLLRLKGLEDLSGA
jgi:phosphatidylserine/phosphatidylglycerophosphate/cardiolipin synthase-like enzyme